MDGEPTIGHNSVAGDKLKEIVNNLEQTQREIDVSRSDFNEILKSAKEAGFDPKAIRVAVKKKMMTSDEKAKQAEFDEKLDLYLHAIGLAKE